MKKHIAVAACCLALSVAPLLAGCSPNSDATDNKVQSNQESGQNTDASGRETEQPITKNDYQDGTYEGEGNGMGGPITVKLTVSDGLITVDEISETAETDGIGGKEAIENGTFKAQIEEAQSADIDGVSGATMTSGGVRKAVEAALAQAK